jgi:peptide/nickel transport system substrate-binding protein
MRLRPLLVFAGIAGALVVSASAGAGVRASGPADTLRIPFLADMNVPDPDIFYDIEGNSVILSVYEGLLKYAPDSTKIVPSLARSWTISPDQLTYTFQIRPGVRFHDGSPLTAKAVKASLQRRLDVNQAPAYMLAGIKQMTTPGPLTLRIVLKYRVGPFMSYMASSWGPKIIGPGAIVKNAGKDFGQAYLQTHGDGTGPYLLSSFERGRQYTLTRNDSYWGAKPSFTKVLLKIVPDIGTQRLELQNGDLDGILHSFPASELSSAKANSKLQVLELRSFLRAMLYLNVNKAPFANPAARAALAKAIDVRQIVSSVYGVSGSVPVGSYPPGILAGEPHLDYGTRAPTAKPSGGHGPVVLAYTADDSGVQRRVGELLQAQIGAMGYAVTLKEVQLPQVYDYVKNLKGAPDLLLITNTPDAAHPDTWARICWDSKGGLNFLGFKDPKIDTLLDKAQSAPTASASALYKQVGKRLIASHSMLFLADVRDTMVLRKDLGGIAHVPAYPWMLDLASLRRK